MKESLLVEFEAPYFWGLHSRREGFDLKKNQNVLFKNNGKAERQPSHSVEPSAVFSVQVEH